MKLLSAFGSVAGPLSSEPQFPGLLHKGGPKPLAVAFAVTGLAGRLVTAMHIFRSPHFALSSARPGSTFCSPKFTIAEQHGITLPLKVVELCENIDTDLILISSRSFRCQQ